MTSEINLGDEIPPGRRHRDSPGRARPAVHSIHPSPFYEKDLDREAEAFIVSSAKKFPSDRPLEIFVNDWWPIRNEERLYQRLSRMPVRIACSGREAPARGPALF